MYPNGYGYGAMQPMPQYQQPVYGQVQAPMMQPQQRYSKPQAQPISGRVISNLNEIVPEEVPMNRQLSFFPMADGSCIYAKMWDGDGNLNTYRYILEQPESTNTLDANPAFIVKREG